MKSLFVLAADADALHLLRAVLQRIPRTIPDIGAFRVEVQRFGGFKDAEIAQQQPSLIGQYPSKKDFDYLLVLWDYHGSGDETRKPPRRPSDAESRVQDRLNGASWLNRSAAVVLVPELEEWLWHDDNGLCGVLNTTADKLSSAAAEYAKKRCLDVPVLCHEQPKELLSAVSLRFLQRNRLQPEHFARIGADADLENWRGSPSFSRLIVLLQTWFPA